MVTTMMKGIRRKRGVSMIDKKYKKGSVAIVPQVPGAVGIKPTPNIDRNNTSGFHRLGAFLSFIRNRYNASHSFLHVNLPMRGLY